MSKVAKYPLYVSSLEYLNDLTCKLLEKLMAIIAIRCTVTTTSSATTQITKDYVIVTIPISSRVEHTDKLLQWPYACINSGSTSRRLLTLW